MDERSARRNQETGCQNDLRGLSASQPRMRADTHDGPEQIAPLQRPDTLMQLSRSSILEVHLVPHGRAIHFGTKRTISRLTAYLSAFGVKRTSVRQQPVVIEEHSQRASLLRSAATVSRCRSCSPAKRSTR